MVLVYVVIGLAAAAAGFSLGYYFKNVTEKNYFKKIEDEASARAREIVNEAKKEAELAKKRSLLEAKDEWFRVKEQFEKDLNAKKDDLRNRQQQNKEWSLDLKEREKTIAKREKEFNAREKFLENKEASLRTKDAELSRVLDTQNERLEQIAHMSTEEAKSALMENLEGTVRLECAQMIKDRRDEAEDKAEKEAQELVLHAIQRCSADTTVESTVSVVQLPNEEMKGRIIGREGRNIRSFEEATGIDVIVDDTPEAVILSCFDPVRREIGRLALEKLISDGRIHPGRIEEVLQKSENILNKKMKEAAEEVMYDLNIHKMNPKLVDLLGRLKYRTSYGQNVLQHSREVAILAGIIAGEIGLDQKVAIRAGLLHDIGKAVDREKEGTHSMLGAELARKNGESKIVCNAVAAHHEDVEPISMYPVLIQSADTISSTRPGVRSETLSNYVDRLTNLEEIADSFKGVTKSYVIQAGREIRAMVEPGDVTDAQAAEVASQIAARIQEEMEYPGQIKVTTIRETRHSDYAK